MKPDTSSLFLRPVTSTQVPRTTPVATPLVDTTATPTPVTTTPAVAVPPLRGLSSGANLSADVPFLRTPNLWMLRMQQAATGSSPLQTRLAQQGAPTGDTASVPPSTTAPVAAPPAFVAQPQDKGIPLPRAEDIDANGVWRAPEVLTDAARADGFRINRVSTRLAGNSHFGGWWDMVHKDSSVVIAQGNFYKGQSVKIGYETFDNAAVIYVKKPAGYEEKSVALDIVGQAGEDVRILYMRPDAGATFEPNNTDLLVKPRGAFQGVGGDSHWRDVLVTVQDHEGVQAKSFDSLFNYHRKDGYGSEPTGPKKTNSLGGDATDALAVEKKVTHW